MVHPKPEVLTKGLSMICIIDISKVPVVNFNLHFFGFEIMKDSWASPCGKNDSVMQHLQN